MDPLVILLHHLELQHRDLYGTGEARRRYPPIGAGVRGESSAHRAARAAWDALKRLHHEATATWLRRLELEPKRRISPGSGLAAFRGRCGRGGGGLGRAVVASDADAWTFGFSAPWKSSPAARGCRSLPASSARCWRFCS